MTMFFKPVVWHALNSLAQWMAFEWYFLRVLSVTQTMLLFYFGWCVLFPIKDVLGYFFYTELIYNTDITVYMLSNWSLLVKLLQWTVELFSAAVEYSAESTVTLVTSQVERAISACLTHLRLHSSDWTFPLNMSLGGSTALFHCRVRAPNSSSCKLGLTEQTPWQRSRRSHSQKAALLLSHWMTAWLIQTNGGWSTDNTQSEPPQKSD